MFNKHKKVFILIFIIVLVISLGNLYLKSKKETVKVESEFKNALVMKNNKIIDEANLILKGQLSDTHFLLKYFKYSKDLKGTLIINNETYNIFASSSIKDKTINGTLSKNNNSLTSDFSVSLSEDLKEICIYNEDYIIVSPSNTLSEANELYNDIVDIPINK